MTYSMRPIYTIFDFLNPADSKAKIICGKENCKKEFSKYSQFYNVSQIVQKTHIDDEHTCGYCKDPKVFETSEDRTSHQSFCKAYILLLKTRRLVNGISQEERRKILPNFLKQNIYISDKPPYLLLLEKINKCNTTYSSLFDTEKKIILSNKIQMSRLNENNIPSTIL